MHTTLRVLTNHRVILVIAMLITSIGAAFAADPINTLEKSLFKYKPNGIAIRGYDTVAYFTQGKPVMGNSEHVTEWMGATWQFASQKNLNSFIENPESYAPQYGGYCAYGVSQGYLVKIEPDQWTIVDNKLYLNYDEDVQDKWVKDIPAFITKADEAITGLLEAE